MRTPAPPSFHDVSAVLNVIHRIESHHQHRLEQLGVGAHRAGRTTRHEEMGSTATDPRSLRQISSSLTAEIPLSRPLIDYDPKGFDKLPVMMGTLLRGMVHLPDFEVIRSEMVELSLHPFLIASGGRWFEDRMPTGKMFVLSCPRIQQ